MNGNLPFLTLFKPRFQILHTRDSPLVTCKRAILFLNFLGGFSRTRASLRVPRAFSYALLVLVFGVPQFLQATIPQLVIHWSTLTETANAYRLQDRNGNPLDAGLAVNGDGSLATLGYFDQATVSEPFKGNWIAMTSGTTVGDSSSGYGYDNGMFSFTTVFTRGSNQVSVYPNEPAGYSVQTPFVILQNAPASGTPICIRFYDRTTTDATARYNTVTGLNWSWPNFSSGIPTNLYLKIAPGTNLSGSKWKYGSTFEDNASTFKTSLRKKALLQVSVFGNGGSVGVTPNNPGGLYEYDSNVTISAVADPHFEFVRWNGPGVSQPTNQTSTVIMSDDRNVTATFKVRQYNLVTTTEGKGTVGITPDTTGRLYEYDDNVSVTATPSPGYQFGYWKNLDSNQNPVSGLDDNLTANATLNVQGAHILIAVFNPLSYSITVNSTSGGTGQVVQQPGPYPFDGNYTLSATANYGHSFSGWTGDANSIALLPSTNANIVPFQLTHPGNLSFAANFTENQYLLTVEYGTGGASASPSPPGPYKHSDFVPITATALHGYQFDMWEDANGSLDNFTQLNATVDMSHSASNVTVKALFKPLEYPVNLTAGVGGQVTINPTAGPWKHFSVYPILATPADGYSFTGWTGDANSTRSLDPLKGTSDANNSLNIVGPVTLTANFALIDFNVTASVGTGSGNVTGSGSYTINDNPPPQVTAIASSGWHFTSWSGDTFAMNSNSSVSSSINLLQHPQNLSLQANFARNSYDVNVTTTGSGLVNGQSSLSLNPIFQDTIDLNATASLGWEFDRWYGHSFPNPQANVVSFAVSSDMELNASFKRSNFAVNVLPSSFGQSSGAGSYEFESNVTISTLPNNGYLFSQWTGDIQYLADPNSSTTIVTIPNNEVNLTPTFTPKTYQVSVSFDSNGTVSGGGSYLFGSTATITPVGDGPNGLSAPAGYEFSKWTVTNPLGQESNSSDDPLSLLIDGNYSVFASFAPIQVDLHDINITVSPPGSGFVFDDPSLRTWNPGTSTLNSTITATHNPGYSFLGWSNPDAKVISPSFRSPTISFSTDVNASLIAQFQKNVVGVATRHSGNGTTQFLSNDASLEINATANIGSTFQGWTVDQNFTYSVTVGNSSVKAGSQVFFLNGVESPNLTLLKGYTYVFSCNTGTNEFYLASQSNSTGHTGEYTHANLTGSRATSGNLVFTVPNDFDTNVTLYYCSSQNPFMGNIAQVIEAIPDATILPFSNQSSITPSVSHDLSLKATFNLNQYNVSIHSGTGGSLTQGSSGTYSHGDSVNLTAIADNHYVFSHWEGGTFASPTSASTTTTISSDSLIQAIFSPLTYNLTLTKNIPGGGDVFTTNGEYAFNFNQTFTIQAQPNPGYVFLSWSNGLANATEQITINQDTTISANFDGEPASVTQVVQTLDVDGSVLNGVTGGFIVTSTNPPYKFGDDLNMTAHDEPGYQFNGWLGTDGALLSSSRTHEFNLASSQTITATFKKLSYEVKVFTAPLVGGTIKADKGTNSQIQTLKVAHGEKVSLEALPSVEYQFDKWTGSGLVNANVFNAQLELTVTQDLSLTASFIPLQPIELKILIMPTDGGFAIGSGSFIYNSKHPIFATPSLGYLFDGWEGVGINDSKAATTSVLLNENKTIKAKFVSDPNYKGDPTAPGLHSLNLVSSPVKGGSTEGSGIFGTGWKNISASENPGYLFSHWDAEGVESVNSANTRIFLTKNTEVTANFRPVTGADLISGSVQLGNSWWYSDWFGPFWHRNGDLWAYHSVLGWIFMDPQKADLSVWFWIEFLDGWQWTTANIYPFLHTSNSATWYWFNKDLSTVKKKLFFKYSDSTGNGAWVSF
ncbi:MAG: hypothetical protein CMI29_07875 [Opitutae bacterium]|nr:hypothetical protein [Opitutae bacterium]